jgi:hypothetical protein
VNESGLDAYLTLLSVCQTCKNKGIGLLGFFLSSERDIDKYRKLGRRKKKPFSLDVLPNRFYEPWRSDFDTTKPSRSGLEDQTDQWSFIELCVGWVCCFDCSPGYGYVEIGDRAIFGFVAAALGFIGLDFEEDKAVTLAKAMAVLEAGLSKWFEEQGIELD